MNTVQLIPEHLFFSLEGNWYGKPNYGTSGLFQEVVLIQPVKYDSRMSSFGLHKTREVTEFIFFNTADPFSPQNHRKNTIVWRVAGGEHRGMLGSQNERYYNRLVEPVSSKKVLYKDGSFHILGAIFQALDLLVRKFHVERMDKYLPLSDIEKLEPFQLPEPLFLSETR